MRGKGVWLRLMEHIRSYLKLIYCKLSLPASYFGIHNPLIDHRPNLCLVTCDILYIFHRTNNCNILVSVLVISLRRVWRYQKGNQKPLIEGQTTQWLKEKKYKRTNNNIQNITLITKDWPTRTPLRRVWRYQRGNQNPYIEEQTTQWLTEKSTKDKQRSTKHYTWN